MLNSLLRLCTHTQTHARDNTHPPTHSLQALTDNCTKDISGSITQQYAFRQSNQRPFVMQYGSAKCSVYQSVNTAWPKASFRGIRNSIYCSLPPSLQGIRNSIHCSLSTSLQGIRNSIHCSLSPSLQGIRNSIHCSLSPSLQGIRNSIHCSLSGR